MNETRDLMTIGEFARASRLTQKALRLYDALGLLEPVRTDPLSGYRYYSAEQLAEAHLIALLRQLEMPLNRIKHLLGLRGPEAIQALRGYWRELETNHQERRGLVRYLESKLEPGNAKGATMFKIETRHIPERKLATIERHVYVKDLQAFLDEAYGAIFAALGRSNAQSEWPGLVLYHGMVNEDSDGPVEVCVPFSGQLEPTGELRVRLEPAHEEAFTRITKAQVKYPEILEAYDAVGAWLMQNRKTVSLSCREVYFTDFMAAREDEPACDIAFPFV